MTIPEGTLDTVYLENNRKRIFYQDNYSISNKTCSFKNIEFYNPYLYTPLEEKITMGSIFSFKKMKGNPDYLEGLYESYIKYPDGDTYKIELELKYEDSLYKSFRRKYVNDNLKENVLIGSSSEEYVSSIYTYSFLDVYSPVRYNNDLYLSTFLITDEVFSIHDLMDKNLFLHSF